MERQIRATKREIEATKSIGGDAQDLQNKLRGQMADYKSFSKAAGLKERDNRLRVDEWKQYSEIYKGISECC